MENLRKILNLILIKNEFKRTLEKLQKGTKSTITKENLYMSL